MTLAANAVDFPGLQLSSLDLFWCLLRALGITWGPLEGKDYTRYICIYVVLTAKLGDYKLPTLLSLSPEYFQAP